MSADTIFALASARGKAGISVVRISGPNAFAAAGSLGARGLAPRHAALRQLRTRDGIALDEAIVIAFEAPGSFTGENVLEIQIHGSMATINALLGDLALMDGLRSAEPGEFTRRAMENGRLDLSQVEGLADLIDAETEYQRVQALHVLQGGLTGLVTGWRHGLVRAMALLDATIDFPDEEDAPPDPSDEVAAILDRLEKEFGREIAGSRAAERLRDGFEVAIVGPPNVGKSTLLNALAGREAALTSSRAGTTRDVIEVRMDVSGIPVTILDTAGLRDSGDELEALGIERARRRAEEADVRIFLTFDGKPAGLGVSHRPEDIVCRGKCDVFATGEGLAVSGKTGEGLDGLIHRIEAVLSPRIGISRAAIRARHRNAISRGLKSLVTARDMLSDGPFEPELVHEHLRACVHALNSLLGKVDVEEVLDEIFSSFCMGK